jgi:hypothetical protein
VAKHSEHAMARSSDFQTTGPVELLHEVEAVCMGTVPGRFDEALKYILNVRRMDVKPIAKMMITCQFLAGSM